MEPTKTETPNTSPEMVKIDSLDKLKQELKIDGLDVSKDEFFKEKQVNFQISKSERDTLQAQMIGTDAQKLEKLKEIINAKQEVIAKTGKETGFLKSKIENLLIELNIRNVKSALDDIEQLENEKDRVFLTNILVGALESNGYSIFINSDKIEIDPKTKSSPELEMLLNNKISQNKTTLDNFKTAILQRTTSLDDYITANTDKNGKLMNEKIDAKSYYEFLIKKSGLDENMFVTVDDIKKNPNLNKKDKAFMISYKNNAFNDVKIDEKMTQFKDQKVELDQKRQNYSPEEKKNMDDKIKIPGDNRTMQQRASDFLKDPFSEIGTIMKNAGPIGMMGILGALIYFMFKEPKLVFGSIAGWGLAKGIGLADHFGNAIEGKNGARDVYTDAAQSVSEGMKWAGNKVVGATLGAKEEIATWYEFNSVQITENGAPVDLVDSNFSILYNQVKSGNIVGLKTKDGKEITPEVKKKIIDKVNDLKKQGIEQFKNEKNFETEIKGKTMAEVIAMLADRKATSSTAPAVGPGAGAGAAALASTPDAGKPAPAPAPELTKEQIESEKQDLKDLLDTKTEEILNNLKLKSKFAFNDFQDYESRFIKKLQLRSDQTIEMIDKDSTKNIGDVKKDIILWSNDLIQQMNIYATKDTAGQTFIVNDRDRISKDEFDRLIQFMNNVPIFGYTDPTVNNQFVNYKGDLEKLNSLDFNSQSSLLIDDFWFVNEGDKFILNNKIKKFIPKETKENKQDLVFYKKYLIQELNLQLSDSKNYNMVSRRIDSDNISRFTFKPFEEWKTEFSV